MKLFSVVASLLLFSNLVGALHVTEPICDFATPSSRCLAFVHPSHGYPLSLPGMHTPYDSAQQYYSYYLPKLSDYGAASDHPLTHDEVMFLNDIQRGYGPGSDEYRERYLNSKSLTFSLPYPYVLRSELIEKELFAVWWLSRLRDFESRTQISVNHYPYPYPAYTLPQPTLTY